MTHCSPRGEPGCLSACNAQAEAKVQERAVTMTSTCSAVGLQSSPVSVSDQQFEGRLKAQTYCLRPGGLARRGVNKPEGEAL